MDLSRGRQLHKQALDAQESGNFEEALKLIDSAMIAYANDNDDSSFAEAHAMRYLTLNHLYQQLGFKGWQVSAKFTVEAGVELARQSGDKKTLGITLFHLAKTLEDLSELDEASKLYKESLNNLSGDEANIENIKNHMEVCAYKAGDIQAIDRAEADLNKLLEVGDDLEYNHQVWISGGYLRIANALRERDRVKAKEFLDKARVYIDAHPDLKLRKEQLVKLESLFS
ncbi:hypothetical protein A2690_04920 [Candidatus Roizmanbacteria bacterium RIFCSPHIGHO2_01_FULL_39_12b]|uniref:MalT-like TPR region domain-containing protein n=1 Tax=Candidatus Roizmanbacteria bacterium RIFCSPHIGHO2_01_FULL_39_12b TaxID=1802030 RepID=A0A1F7GDT0_9BACT|nr:MAG: hypothetical protein A2690_04920 [Candidatus Roizmanbacteria bacterium RIFCSPHIGHO2_01_FULL_39_12b]